MKTGNSENVVGILKQDNCQGVPILLFHSYDIPEAPCLRLQLQSLCMGVLGRHAF